MLRTLGYFSLIGLLRMHTLLGDYEAALKALAPIHPFRNAHSLTSSIAGGLLSGCQLLCHMAAEVHSGAQAALQAAPDCQHQVSLAVT